MWPWCQTYFCQSLPSTGITLFQKYYGLIRLPECHLQYLTVHRLDIAFSCKEGILGLPSSHSLRLIPCYGLRPRWTHITLPCPRALCYIPRPEVWTNGGMNTAFRYANNVSFQNHQISGLITFTSIVAWYPFPPASHQSVARLGVGFSSEGVASLFLRLDFHQLANTNFARRACVLCALCGEKNHTPQRTQRAQSVQDLCKIN